MTETICMLNVKADHFNNTMKICIVFDKQKGIFQPFVTILAFLNSRILTDSFEFEKSLLQTKIFFALFNILFSKDWMIEQSSIYMSITFVFVTF